MNFFKQAQEFAASQGGGDNTGAAPGAAPGASGDGGFGNYLSEAQGFLKSQGGAPTGDGSAAPADGQGTLPGGRTPPTNQDLLHSGQVLFEAVQGQKIDQTQLAGAASDILGGLAAHGNIDQGTYGTYINQAEQYLDKYAEKGAGAGAGVGAGAGAAAGAQAPPAQGGSQVNPGAAPVGAGSTDDYAPDQQQQQAGGDSQY